MIRVRVTGVERAANRLLRVGKQVNEGLKDATRQAIVLVQGAAEKRILLPKRLSAQDSSAPRRLSGRKPLYMRVSSTGMEGYVGIRTHWTPARTSGIYNVFARLGKLGQLVRSGLWVSKTTWVKDARGKFQGRKRGKYDDRQNLQFLRFSKHPNLLPWALKANKGRQMFRHAVRMNKDAIEVLIATPALVRNKTAIKQLYGQAVLRGILV